MNQCCLLTSFFIVKINFSKQYFFISYRKEGWEKEEREKQIWDKYIKYIYLRIIKWIKVINI